VNKKHVMGKVEVGEVKERIHIESLGMVREIPEHHSPLHSLHSEVLI
jgi:hypothetical protein